MAGVAPTGERGMGGGGGWEKLGEGGEAVSRRKGPDIRRPGQGQANGWQKVSGICYESA